MPQCRVSKPSESSPSRPTTPQHFGAGPWQEVPRPRRVAPVSTPAKHHKAGAPLPRPAESSPTWNDRPPAPADPPPTGHEARPADPGEDTEDPHRRHGLGRHQDRPDSPLVANHQSTLPRRYEGPPGSLLAA